ncbi:MAG: exodeoxyribonuclease III [Gammaproteobacteria bacterium]|nr:exodeoxyribonuclease III [Gammaproteobacteria bacterium]MCD8524247.1 exodeoxyribonuclease III [Gammaproteobacteria bacterium]MCD8543271.1 exodeoxyribonuclease III [Gammaproteobacteria bacterium]
MSFSIATWNVNSLLVRLPHVIAWLEQHQPDVLALQEIKCPNEKFPYDAFIRLGYHCFVSGQKTYNGVALLSRHERGPAPVCAGFPNFLDEQRRLLGVTIQDILIVNVYVPNGAAVGTEKYAYKLEWLSHLQRFIQESLAKKIIILGDFNIAPADADIYEPLLWHDQVLASGAERDAWEGLLALGFVDCYRHLSPSGNEYTWWDYRQAAFRRNMGLRIDHILASALLVPQLKECCVDKIPRAWERPSDHAPVIASFFL